MVDGSDVFLKGRKAWKHRGTEAQRAQRYRRAGRHGNTEAQRAQSYMHSIPSVFSSRLLTLRLFSHRLFSHRLFSHRLFSHRLFSHRLFSHRLFSLCALCVSVFQKKVQRVCERVCARVWSTRVSPARLAQGLLRVRVCLLKLRAMRRLGYRLGPWRLQARSRASLPRRR